MIDMNVLDMAEGDGWTLYNADTYEAIAGLPDNSVDYSISSPPFASLFTYDSSIRDGGNVRDYAEFFEQFSYLVPQLLRVIKSGRLCSMHCMQIPTSKTRDGYIGIRDFRGDLIRAFQKEGWIFHSEVCIWKDPVVAMQRTKALGLLYKQLKKDSAMSRQGIPDYVVTFRKPGVNDEPVTKDPEQFPVALWQRYASPVWTDINQTRTLSAKEAREDADSRHLCCLQLDVIERCIDLWTNPGDRVLSPFTGIGSEGYVALQKGRKFVGFEYKRSYWEQAKRHLAKANKQTSIFDHMAAAQ